VNLTAKMIADPMSIAQMQLEPGAVMYSACCRLEDYLCRDAAAMAAGRRTFFRDVLWLVLYGKVRTRNHRCPSLQVSPPHPCRIVANDILLSDDGLDNVHV
jgi:hypothetical protein